MLNKKFKWLITGAAGFVGSSLCEYLIKNNQDIVAIDNFITGDVSKVERLKELASQNKNSTFLFYNLDINETEAIKKIAEECQLINHQAAISSVPRSVDNPIETNNCNVTGFLSILEVAKACKIKRVVFASSASIYGDNADSPKKEDKLGKALSPYGSSKRSMEIYAESYVNSYDLEVIGLRYFNIFGPGQDPDGDYANVIPRWISEAVNKKQSFVFGDGKTTRDFIFISDIIQANINASITTNQQAFGQSINIGSGIETSLNSLYETIIKQIHKKDSRLKVQEIQYKDFRKGDTRFSVADITNAKRLLNFEPQANLDESIAQTIDFFIS